MKYLHWLKNNWRYILMVLAGIDAVGSAVVKYLEANDGPTDWNGALMTAGMALFLYLKKAPGDLTETEAKRLAHDHAADTLARASLPPAPVAQPSWDELARGSLVPPRE